MFRVKYRLLRKIVLLNIANAVLASSAYAGQCADPRDSYNNYDNNVRHSDIRNIQSEYYLMSYSWAPRFCQKASKRSKQPGAKNYLQCHPSKRFGYILHGLWPQGKKSGLGGYPRACAGDQPKIARSLLNPYLCMTPSVWLLQHEYEYHGTCMPNAKLQTAKGYLDKALAIHRTLKLPKKELGNNKGSYSWWYNNNQSLPDGAVKYAKKSKEWQFCFDRSFTPMRCPGENQFMGLKPDTITDNNGVTYKQDNRQESKTTLVVPAVQTNSDSRGCRIKGNISKKALRKWYFLPSHPQYRSVKIDTRMGERCFENEKQAISAGWKKSR